MGDDQDRQDIADWCREEALNFDKLLGELMGGDRRLDFVSWKARRDAVTAEFPEPRIARGEG